LERLRSGNRFHRALAAEKLGRLRTDKASEDLIRLLKDRAREVRIVAVRALGDINPPEGIWPLIDLLISAVNNPEVMPLRVIKTAIIKYKERGIQHLKPLLHHESWRVRAQTADIVGEIGSSIPVEILISKLSDPEPDVRAKVARALGKIQGQRGNTTSD